VPNSWNQEPPNQRLDDNDKIFGCLYCLKCTKFGRVILRKIINIVATRCQILRLNAPNSISAGAPPQTPLGSSQRSPRPLAGFKGPTSKGKGRGRERGREGNGRGKGRGKGRKNDLCFTLLLGPDSNCGSISCHFWDIQCRKMPRHWNRGQRSLKVMIVHALDIVPLRSETPPQKRSGMPRVLKGFQFYLHTHTFIRNRNELYLPLLSQL